MKRIMCVDDDKIASMITKITLNKHAEFAIDLFTDSLLAFDVLRSELKKDKNGRTLPDFILLDLNMPVMDGWEFLDAFQAEIFKGEPGIKILIISSSVDPADKIKAMQYPFVSHFIPKPIPENIVELLEKDS